MCMSPVGWTPEKRAEVLGTEGDQTPQTATGEEPPETR